MDHSESQTVTLSDRVAEELRALLARRRMSGRDLAKLLGVSPSWVSYRLTGSTEIGLTDLEKIAAALDVEVAALLPTPRDSARAADKAYSGPVPARTTTTIGRPRHLPIRCATRPAPNGHVAVRQESHSGHGDRRPVIQPWTHDGVAA